MQIRSNMTKKRKTNWKSSYLITLLKKYKNLRNYLDRIVIFCLLGEYKKLFVRMFICSG
jgi:hypothetical protein